MGISNAVGLAAAEAHLAAATRPAKDTDDGGGEVATWRGRAKSKQRGFGQVLVRRCWLWGWRGGGSDNSLVGRFTRGRKRVLCLAAAA